MNRRPPVRSFRHIFILLLFLAFLTLGSSSPVLAQSGSIVQKLSPNTVLYVEWRGMASLSAQEKQNHLLQLLRDPSIAPMLGALGAQMNKSGPQGANPMATMVAADLLSFLDNAIVVGVTADPEAAKSATPGKTTSPFSGFLVYDATGKADLIQRWRAVRLMGSKTHIDATKYDFGGTSVEVWTTSTGAQYLAQTGNYFLSSDQKKVIEDLITRFSGNGSSAASMAQVPECAEVRKYVGENAALEFFGRIPDVSQWGTPEKSAKTIRELASNIHLEKVRVMAGGVSFDGEAARIRGAILGDTSSPSPFDVTGASSATFATLPAMQGAPAFSISRINLAALYQLLIGALSETMTPQQTQNMAVMQGAAQGFLGMSIPDALKLFTGEIASSSSATDDGTLEQSFAVSIQKPDAVLRVVRALFSTMIVSEDSEGTTTFLNLAYPYMDPETHQRRRKFYYVAVTPQVLLAAPRKAMLRQSMQHLNAEATNTPAAGVLANSDYAQLRARLPEKLSGLGAMDVSALPWDKILSNFATQAAQSAQQSGQKAPDLSAVHLDVINRYLHVSVSGWWKDANGLYFDSYIQ